jgi:hypothetical protein
MEGITRAQDETRATRSDDIGKLILALSKAQGQMNGATKDSKNPFFKSKYADLHSCIEAAKKPLSDNELAVIQTTENTTENKIKIKTLLGHSSGQWIEGELIMTPKKDDDQGRGSSITYGRRYAFAAIVGLAQKDDDGNGSVQHGDEPPAQPKPKKTPPKSKNKVSADWETIFDKASLKTIAEIKEWRVKNGKEIIATLNETEQQKFKGYLSDCEELILEDSAPEIECKETGLLSSPEMCRKSKCSSDYNKCKEAMG